VSTASTARRRGAETQRYVAEYMAGNGWPFATDAGAGRNGRDILNTAGLSIEVKARRNFSPAAWMRQAAKESGIPICVHRPYGAGITTVGDWPALLRLADLVVVLRDAGYGDPIQRGESQ
jgi:hypothetical protein